LLAGLLLGELAVLVGAGVVSPAVLRAISTVEPLNRIAMPVAFRLSKPRRRIFASYILSLRNQLRRDRQLASNERYLALPALMRTSSDETAELDIAPAKAIRDSVQGRQNRRHVLIVAHGGCGKSALIREVVERALDAFEKSPTTVPLPIVLTGSSSIETMIVSGLDGVLPSSEWLPAQLHAGDFFIVLDGVSESGLPDNAVAEFINGRYRDSVYIVASSRPNKALASAFEGAASWLICEPQRLGDSSVDAFTRHYGGRALEPSVREWCRSPDDTYVPLLVRMALDSGAAMDGDGSAATIFRNYVLRMFERKFAGERNLLTEFESAAAWCVETYWKDGRRVRNYTGSGIERELLDAGILVALDNVYPPKEVRFFHDSMQSFLTAVGLHSCDKQGYSTLAKINTGWGELPWNRERVMLRSAAHRLFCEGAAEGRSGQSELYQMLVAVFSPRDELRDWLKECLKRLASKHADNLRRRDVMRAIPADISTNVGGPAGTREVLLAAIDVAYRADLENSSTAMLGAVFGNLAPVIYELETSPD
jgi:hypothetical protein